MATLEIASGGTLSFEGVLGKKTYKRTGGTLSFRGSLIKTVDKRVGGTLSFEGTLRKTVWKYTSRTLSFVGTLIVHPRTIYIYVERTLLFVGTLIKGRRLNRQVGGTLSFEGTLKKVISKKVGGRLNFTGRLTIDALQAITSAIIEFKLVVTRLIEEKVKRLGHHD